MEIRFFVLLMLPLIPALKPVRDFATCSPLGPAYSSLDVQWFPATPSLQSLAELQVTINSPFFSNWYSLDLTLTSSNSQIYLWDNFNPSPPPMFPDVTYRFNITVPIPSPLILEPGLYSYQIALTDGYVCFQASCGTVQIGTNLGFEVTSASWNPPAPEAASNAVLTLEGVYPAQGIAEITACQVDILTSGESVISINEVECHMGTVQAGMPFSITSSPIAIPDLAPGNYTAKVNFMGNPPIGYTEIALQIAGNSPFSYIPVPNSSFLVGVILYNASSPVTIPYFTQTDFSPSEPGFIRIRQTIMELTFDEGDYLQVMGSWCGLFLKGNWTSRWEIYGEKGGKIGVIDTYCESLHPQGTVTAFTVTPSDGQNGDILFLEARGNLLSSVPLQCQARNYTYSLSLQPTLLDTDGSSYALLSLPASDIAMDPGNILIACFFNTFYDPRLYYVFSLNEGNEGLTVTNWEYMNQTVIALGGYIGLTLAVESGDLGTNCEVEMTNYTASWSLGSCYCEVQETQYGEELVIPAIPLPEYSQYIASGPYVLKILATSQTNTIGNYVENAFFLNKTSEIAPISISILPSSPRVGDILTLSLIGTSPTGIPDVRYQACLVNSSAAYPWTTDFLSVSVLSSAQHFQINATLPLIAEVEDGGYALSMCLEEETEGWVCWRAADVSVMSGARLQVLTFAWSGEATSNGNMSFSISASSISPGLFDQSLCQVQVSNASSPVVVYVVPCIAGIVGYAQDVTITSGVFRLPEGMGPGTYAVDIWLVSSAWCWNVRFAETLVVTGENSSAVEREMSVLALVTLFLT